MTRYTRYTWPDPYAAALHNVHVAGGGVVLLPSPFTHKWPGSSPIAEMCPLPAPGEAFFVGEAHDWTSDGRDPATNEIRWLRQYRANKDQKVRRWHAGRSMPEFAARSRFEVVSRVAVRADHMKEDSARSAGIPYYGAGLWMGPPLKKGQGYFESAYDAVRRWWPLWHRVPWTPTAWVWCVEVKSI